MANQSKTKLVLRIPLDRAPTQLDRRNRLGLKTFLKKLHEEGWADENGNALKNLTITSRGYAGLNNNYIEWTAQVKE